MLFACQICQTKHVKMCIARVIYNRLLYLVNTLFVYKFHYNYSLAWNDDTNIISYKFLFYTYLSFTSQYFFKENHWCVTPWQFRTSMALRPFYRILLHEIWLSGLIGDTCSLQQNQTFFFCNLETEFLPFVPFWIGEQQISGTMF